VRAGRAVLITAARYRSTSYGANHPLGIPRVSLTVDLIEALGAVTPAERLDSRRATPAELEAFHTRAYVAAMQRCELLGRVPDRYRRRHNIGNYENPWFPDFYTTPATATGGSVQGAEQVLAGRIAFSPAGGMHHAAPDQARGFCFFNDPVLAILRLRRAGWRVLYLDLDAHHGDGVEAAFREDPGVVTVSIHMDTAYAYPYAGGGLEDVGPLGNAVNLPLPEGLTDAGYRHAFDTLWPAVAERFRPDAVVLQAGTDMLAPDPLGRLRISNRLFLELVERVLRHAPRHPDGTPRVLVLGGGGYHPLALARCWTAVWLRLAGRPVPERLPPAARAVLEAVDWDLDEDEPWYPRFFTHLLDEPVPGAVPDEVRARAGALLRRHPLFRGRARALAGGAP